VTHSGPLAELTQMIKKQACRQIISASNKPLRADFSWA
jgi:hypothetical protein